MRVVRIAFGIGVGMVETMGGDPFNGTALQRERSEQRREVFEGPGKDHAAMREREEETERDAHGSREPPERDRYAEGAPRKECGNQHRESANVQDAECQPHRPLELFTIHGTTNILGEIVPRHVLHYCLPRVLANYAVTRLNGFAGQVSCGPCRW